MDGRSMGPRIRYQLSMDYPTNTPAAKYPEELGKSIWVIGWLILVYMLLMFFCCVIFFRRELRERVPLWLLHMEIRAWYARAREGIFNWKNACATFVMELAITTTNLRNDELKHFEWTCHCGRIFDETVREVVPGAVAEWIEASSSHYDPMPQVSASRVRMALVVPHNYVTAFRRLCSAVSCRAVLTIWVASISLLLAITMYFASSAPESGGSRANFHDAGVITAVVFSCICLFLSMAAVLRYGLPMALLEGKALSHSGVDTGAGGDTQGNNDTGLPPQATEQAGTLPETVAGEPIAAPYAEIIGVEQGGRPPRDGSNPPSPKIEPEDAPSHFDHVLLLIKQGRHRTKFFSTGLRGKWTDRDTFSQIKDCYDCYKRSWWYLNTLSHVEFKKFYIYHSDHIDIPDREKEEVPICEQQCEKGCGRGCLGYWYTPPRVKMIPPIPRKAMLHFLQSPDCLGTRKHNRAALPKRREILKLGILHLSAGWGLYFKEKVWSLPIVTVQLLSIFSAIAVTVFWTVFHEKTIGSLVPGVFILLIGQGVAELLQRWAEYNLDEEAKT